MLLFINVVSITYFLGDVLIQFGKIDCEIKDNWQILILKGIYGLSNSILICDKVSFLEIDLFLYNVF